MLNQIENLCLTYFLCQFDPNSKKIKTKDIIRRVALPYYSREKIEEFIQLRLDQFQTLLVSEFNSRLGSNRPLRFQIADTAAVGSIVKGYRHSRSKKEIKFQDALHAFSPREFEMLAAVLLRLIGCEHVFYTPASHDQGVDAFGYQILVEETPYGTTHHLTWVAQAKHYHATDITTGDIRELVGSRELLVARVFSTVDERYKELQLKHYAPIVIALVTSEEVPDTVRRLAEGAGVYVFASSDLFHLIAPKLTTNSTPGIKALLKKEGQTIRTLS